MATQLQVSSLPGITFHPQGLTSRAKLRARGRDFTKVTKHYTTIQQSMKELNVRWLDVLKMDIEGEEWAVMLEMLESGMDMPFTQILIGRLIRNRSDLCMLIVTTPISSLSELQSCRLVVKANRHIPIIVSALSPCT